MKFRHLGNFGGAAFGIVGVFMAVIVWVCLIAIGDQVEKSKTKRKSEHDRS